MTITVNLVAVADNIAHLNVPGVSILDIDQIPADAKGVVPCLFPVPDDYITDISFSRVTMGTGGTAKMDMSYTLNYRYLHALIGSGGGLLSNYAGMLQNLAALLKVVFANDVLTKASDGSALAVDISLQNISSFEPKTDPAGVNQYHSFDISFRVLEFVQ